MTIEQKRDMIIKGYNPNNQQDVQMYLQGQPKNRGYEEVDLGGANQPTIEYDDEGNQISVINESALLYREEPIIKKTNTNKQLLTEDEFGLKKQQSKQNLKEKGFQDGLNYLKAFITGLQTGQRGNALKLLNNVIKNSNSLGKEYISGVREAEIKLLDRFN